MDNKKDHNNKKEKETSQLVFVKCFILNTSYEPVITLNNQFLLLFTVILS
jgi:hypothetical protein